MSTRIGYLGPEATFTHMAVTRFFGSEIMAVPYQTIPDCMDAVAGNEVKFAVVPLENTIEGSVNLTVDYLVHEQHLYICGEITAPIAQHLMVNKGNTEKWKKAEKVYSHPHALAQCHKYLHTNFRGISLENAPSTGAAARYASEHFEERIAVIANEMAASVYNLEIVERDIQDYSHNHTRFVILHPSEDAEPASFESLSSREKTTLVITLPSDQSGTLHQVLSAFAWRRLNLSKIESRPRKTGLGNYFFIIDIEQGMDSILIPGAISELEALGCGVKLLGSYKAYNL
ncbi:prephenate dehydratase [Metabacillus sp. RGM 3146]|uniref:prephenate dehydratase n=1 Tax=Metabacillus sp. RGM 3146 TaxID=3401092 RepID=UPI003B9C472B